MSIEQQLGLEFPVYWNDYWPIEKQFAKYLIYKIVTNRPSNVVELGSGISTLIILKTLEKLGGDYKLKSFDSDEEFLEGTKNLLIAEKIYDEKKVELNYAPIKDLEIDGNLYKWYDKDKINIGFEKIDLLFVDGPVGGFCKNSRYPAMKAMRRYLKPGSLVVLHDAKRPDEIEIVEMWKKENPEIKSVYEIETERGGVEIIF